MDTIESTLNNVNHSWTKDQVIRYLYIKLARFVQRDLIYFLASDEQKEYEYSKGFINRFPNIICSTLADFYVNIFNKFGINSKKVKANSAKIPLFSVIVEGENGWYYLDPINDLFSNQYGIKPFFFGVVPKYNTIQNNYKELVKLPDEYVDELDKSLDITFRDELFEMYHQKLAHKDNANEFFGLPRGTRIDLKERKIELYNEKFINLGNVDGLFERAQLYKYLNDRIMNKTEKKNICIKIIGTPTNPELLFAVRTNHEVLYYQETKKEGKYSLVKKR